MAEFPENSSRYLDVVLWLLNGFDYSVGDRCVPAIPDAVPGKTDFTFVSKKGNNEPRITVSVVKNDRAVTVNMNDYSYMVVLPRLQPRQMLDEVKSGSDEWKMLDILVAVKTLEDREELRKENQKKEADKWKFENDMSDIENSRKSLRGGK